MPKDYTVVSSKFYNQLKNGNDFSLNPLEFTPNLVASVGENIKAVFELDVQWYEEAQGNSLNIPLGDLGFEWDVQATSITSSFKFDDSPFEVGQVFDFLDPIFEFNATITAIGGFVIEFTVNAGSVPVGTTSTAIIRATSADNPLESLVYLFGLLENGEPFNNLNKVSENGQTYQSNSVGLGSPSRSTVAVPLIKAGSYSDWITGEATVAYVSETTYVQRFVVEHEFTVVPFSQDTADFDSNTKPLPLQVAGLKYAYSSDFKTTATSPKTFPFVKDNVAGLVQWYDESLLPGEYSVTSIVYEDTATTDSVTALQDSERTTATIRIAKSSGSFAAGQRAGLTVSLIPASESEYKDTTTDLPSNFLFDSIYHNEGAAITTGTGAIKSLGSAIDSGDLVLTAEIEYTLAQGQQAELKDYIISAIIGDESIAPASTDKVNLLADNRQYGDKNVIPSLCTFGTMLFCEHNKPYVAGMGKSSLNLWNEDGILCEIPFALDLAQDAFIDRLRVQLVAYNTVTGNTFKFGLYDFQTSAATVVLGVQQILIQAERDYNLIEGDQFNFARIETGTKVGDIQNYVCLIGQKMDWQSWIANLEADTVFYDNSEPNDNLNDQTSNYSSLNNYEIKIEAIADVRGTNTLGRFVTGQSEAVSGNLNVNDYGLDGNPTPILSGVTATFDYETGADLGGDILEGKQTLFQITWSSTAGPIASTTTKYAIHRIETFEDVSEQIEEISDTNVNPNNLLLSLDGSGFLDKSLDSGNLITKCLIDGTKLNPNVNYSLSGRLKK